ncbi:MAG: HD domain-containing protein, partial [Bacteroidota bacterium]
MNNSTFLTHPKGIAFDILNPKPDMFHIEDIANALANICRFGGQVPIFYSVADHSLRVCQMVQSEDADPRLALTALLHDASEAYLGDVITPLKLQLSEYRAIEANLEQF